MLPPLPAFADFGPLPCTPPDVEVEVAPSAATLVLVPPATFPHDRDDDDDDGDRDVGGHCPKTQARAHITPTAANCARVERGRRTG